MRNFKIRDDETIYEMLRLHNTYSGMFDKYHKEQSELYDFTVGALQWDEAVRKQLQSERRPANSYNLIRTIINVIFSIEKDNRGKGIAVPRYSKNNQLANVITQTLDYFLYNTDINDAAKRVFLDTIIARFGVFQVGWQYDGSTDNKGSLLVTSADPREFMFEPVFDDPLWHKASFVMRKHQMSIDDILNTFALNDDEMSQALIKEASIFYDTNQKADKWISKRLKALFTAVYETATGFSSSQGDNVFKNYLNWFDSRTGRFDILELHEKRTERRLIVKDVNSLRMIDITEIYYKMLNKTSDADANLISIDKGIISKIKGGMGISGNTITELQPRRFQTIIIPAFNMKIDERAYPVETSGYVYIPQYCYDYHADPLKSQSVIDDLKDPQADFNKSKSLILELLGRYANKGWILDENAISGLEEDWETNKIAPYRRVRAGYINMIKPEQGQTISPELIRMPLELQGLMKTISNADDEVRGNASPGVTSGKHFQLKEQRQAKSYTYLLENRDRTHREVYQTSLDFIQYFAQTQQVIRVVNPDTGKKGDAVTINQSVYGVSPSGQMVEHILNDINAEKYDIEISEEPYSVTAQEERYSKLGDLFNATASINPEKADALLDIFVEVGNFPKADEILSKWEAIKNPPKDENQQAAEQQAMLLQQIAAKLGIEEKKAEIMYKHAQTKKLESETAGQRIENILGYKKEPEQKPKTRRKRKKYVHTGANT